MRLVSVLAVRAAPQVAATRNASRLVGARGAGDGRPVRPSSSGCEVMRVVGVAVGYLVRDAKRTRR